MEQIIERGDCNFDPTPYIDSRVKASPEEFKLALEGDVTPATLIKMRAISNRLDFLDKQKAELEQSMASLSEDFSHQLKLLDSAPGINSISAISIISEIGDNMKVFGSVGKFLSWIGVVPQNNESAGKKKSTRIAKGNSWLKPVIVQCANAAIKDKKHPEIREKYLELKRRRGHKKAIIAIAKRLLTAIYYMLLRNEVYKPYTGKETAHIRGKIEIDRLITYYQSKGYVITASGKLIDSLNPLATVELVAAEG
jgi:transposase